MQDYMSHLQLFHGFQTFPTRAVAVLGAVRCFRGDQHCLAVLAVELSISEVYECAGLQRVVVCPTL